MPRFAANLTFLWPDLPVLERFRAAACARFRRVEILFVHDLDPGAVEAVLRETGLALWLFDSRAGDWAKGERGLLGLPGREAEFRASLEEALLLARRFGTLQINALAGIPPPGVAENAARRTAVANLRWAAPRCQAEGRTLLVENINRVDMPGYLAATPDRAAELVLEADSPAIRLQLDQYHAAMAGIDPRAALRRHRALVGHVQIADVPGRNQPGTGAQPIAALLEELDALGYAGAVGLEYRPRGGMDGALAWLAPGRRG